MWGLRCKYQFVLWARWPNAISIQCNIAISSGKRAWRVSFPISLRLELVQEYDSFADKMNGILKLQQKPIDTCKTELIKLSAGKFHKREDME